MNIEGIITFLVVLTYLYLYHNNEKRNKKDLDKNHNDIIELHKKKYKPFDSDNRLSTTNKDRYELVDIALTATEIVYEAPIPNQEEINSLVRGDLVKLKFLDKGGEVERMWVEYLTKEDDLHLGILRNDSFDNSKLSYEQYVYFHSNHIFIIEKS